MAKAYVCLYELHNLSSHRSLELNHISIGKYIRSEILFFLLDVKATFTKDTKVFFESKKQATGIEMKFDGVPFINVAVKNFACHQGQDRHQRDKENYKRAVEKEQVYDM